MNKLKGKFERPNVVVFTVIAAASLIILLPIRVYQAVSLIEPATGFFKGFHFTIPLFYCVLAISAAFIFIGSYTNNVCNRVRDSIKKSKLLGIFSLFTAFAFIYESAENLVKYRELTFSSADDFTALLQSGSPNAGASGRYSLLFAGIFGLLSALFFLVYSLKCFTNANINNALRFLSIMPTVWAICRIVFRFVRKISFVNISDLLLELFMLVFFIAFFLSFAQIVTNITPDIVAWRVFGCGLPAAVIAFVLNATRLILVIFDSTKVVSGYGFNACDLVLSLFIPVFLFCTSTLAKDRSKE